MAVQSLESESLCEPGLMWSLDLSSCMTPVKCCHSSGCKPYSLRMTLISILISELRGFTLFTK